MNVVKFEKSKSRPYEDLYEKNNGDNVEFLPELTETNIKILLESMGIKVKFNEISKDTISDTKLLDKKDDEESYEQILISMIEDEIMRDNFKSRSIQTLKRKLDVIAFRNSYNPIRDYLNQNYLNNKSKLYNNEYESQFEIIFNSLKIKKENKTISRMLLKKWLISCVASQIEEYFESHGVITFSGKQGMGKTAFIRNLIPYDLKQYFKGGFHLDVKNKDQKIIFIKNWIVELGEVGSTLKKDMDMLKAFITSGTDTVRNPYGMKEKTSKRRTVAAATVDTLEFLKDDTNRRFWVIELDDIDLNIKFDINMLWAEIYDMYVNNESWWLEKNEIEKLNKHNMNYRLKNEVESFLYAAFEWDDDKRYYIDVNTLYMFISKQHRNITSSKIGKALLRMEVPFVERRARKRFYKVPALKPEFNEIGTNFDLKYEIVENEMGKAEEKLIKTNLVNIRIITINRMFIPSVINTKIDLSTENKQLIIGKIFIDEDDIVYIPEFENKEIIDQCNRNLYRNLINRKIEIGKNIFEQLKEMENK